MDPDGRFIALAFFSVFGPLMVGQCIAWAQEGHFSKAFDEWAHMGVWYRLRQAWAVANGMFRRKKNTPAAPLPSNR